jgi:hypothetical protein
LARFLCGVWCFFFEKKKKQKETKNQSHEPFVLVELTDVQRSPTHKRPKTDDDTQPPIPPPCSPPPLPRLVEQHGTRKWSFIARLLHGRIGKQCRERWHNHLRPDIKRGAWTELEEKLLIDAHEVGLYTMNAVDPYLLSSLSLSLSLKAPGFNPCTYNNKVKTGFKPLLSNATCTATPRSWATAGPTSRR